MTAKYLIRFDDICPTMDWAIWNDLETVLIENDIKPIIAVIPDNKDKSFFLSEPASDFWKRVKKWQDNGWTIGLHGYQHQYVTQDRGLLCLKRQSEFAGIDEETQYHKLQSGLNIFKENNITPEIWVAPSNSFDLQTIKALKRLGLNLISDGFSFRPFRYQDMVWIPHQVWRFRPFPFGLWTVCYHHNTWKPGDLEQLIKDIKKYRHQIISLQEVLNNSEIKERNYGDMIFHSLYCKSMKVKMWLSRT
jgi:predicted deacetylase